MNDLLLVQDWRLYVWALITFGFAPGFVLRLALLLYSKEDERRDELLAELYAVPRWKRPMWVAEQLETAIFEGPKERWRRRGLKPRWVDGRRLAAPTMIDRSDYVENVRLARRDAKRAERRWRRACTRGWVWSWISSRRVRHWAATERQRRNEMDEARHRLRMYDHSYADVWQWM